MSEAVGGLDVQWLGRVGYADGLALQEGALKDRIRGDRGDRLLLLEHPPVVTLGRNTREENLLLSAEELAARGVEVHSVPRGGDVTFHAPGQLVGYLVVDLEARGQPDLHRFLRGVESALIEATNSALNAVPPLAAGQALLEALRALPRPSQPIRTGKESTPDYARRLIPWINATLSLPGITPTLAEAFHIGLKDKTAAIGRAEELAVTVRRWWQPNQSTGWAPTDAHKEAVAETSSATWANTAAALATLASAYKAGCLAYLPVRSVLQRKPRPRRVHDRAQNAPPPHRHVHRLWSGVEELATTAEERDCMESFSEQFSRLRSQLETATAVLNVALEEALNTNANQQHAAYAYLRMMVLEDYAATPLSERQAWVRRLAASLDVPFKSPKPGLKARGSTVWRWLGALSTAAGSVAWFFLP